MNIVAYKARGGVRVGRRLGGQTASRITPSASVSLHLGQDAGLAPEHVRRVRIGMIALAAPGERLVPLALAGPSCTG